MWSQTGPGEPLFAYRKRRAPLVARPAAAQLVGGLVVPAPVATTVPPVPGPVPAVVTATVIFPAVGGLLAPGADRREHLSYSHRESSLINWGPDTS